MTVREYQAKAHTFANYMGLDKSKDTNFNQFIYPVMGLAEESGEVVGKFSKVFRDENGTLSESKKTEIKKELGDVCWFVAEICTLLNLNLGEVMQSNIDKLQDRLNRNVIHGSGDNR